MTSGIFPEPGELCTSEPHSRGRPVAVEGELGESSEVDVRGEAWDKSRIRSAGLPEDVLASIFPELGDITKTLDPSYVRCFEYYPTQTGHPQYSVTASIQGVSPSNSYMDITRLCQPQRLFVLIFVSLVQVELALENLRIYRGEVEIVGLRLSTGSMIL
jgi:hypothetical protein